jgi:hypothetical protein
MLNLEKRDFHKFPIFNQNKIYEIQLKYKLVPTSKSYLFSKEQILILSPFVYNHILKFSQTFIIEEDNFHGTNDCFDHIYLLFSKNETVLINKTNRKCFDIIAAKLKIKQLLKSC